MNTNMSDKNTYTAMADKPLKDLDFDSGYSIYVTLVSVEEFAAFLHHIRDENVEGLYRYFISGDNTVRLDFLNSHDAFNYCRYVDLVTTLHKKSHGAKQFLRVRYENNQSGTVTTIY